MIPPHRPHVRTPVHPVRDLSDLFPGLTPGRGPVMSLEQALVALGCSDPATLGRVKLRDPALLGRHCAELVTRGVVSRDQLALALGRMANLSGVPRIDIAHAPPVLIDWLFPPAPLPPPEWPAPACNLAQLEAALAEIQRQPILSLRQAIVALGLLDAAALDRVQAEIPQLFHGHHQLLVRRGLLTAEELGHALARASGIPDVDPGNFTLAPDVFQVLPERTARNLGVLPLGMLGDGFFVATPTPTDLELRKRLGDATGKSILMAWGDDVAIGARLDEVERHGLAVLTTRDMMEWMPPAPAEARRDRHAPGRDLSELVVRASSEVAAASLEHDEPVGAVGEQSAMAQLVQRMLLDARQAGASDIHIEMSLGDGAPVVRMRVDGEMRPYQTWPGALRAALVSRIKVMSRLDIAEHRRPQDGKIYVADAGGSKLELRVAVLPTHDGMENVVLRLLGDARPVPLPDLGLQPRDLEAVQRMTARSFGVVLVVGPTGSGKTTTLHSILRQLNTSDRKIWTVEDPIEITQPGLNQVQVNPRIGLSFASALRSFLRADPDIIMVGEIRDSETAEVAIEASLTGHLVLSTLHTNSAADTLIRLLELNVDPVNFSDALVGIVAQRLVRALCRHCRVQVPLGAEGVDALIAEYVAHSAISPVEAAERLLEAAGVDELERLSAGHTRGCERCGGRGYKGRIGVYEVLENSPPLAELIRRNAPPADILSAALQSGMRSLRHDALEKVVQGVLDLAQARSAYL